MKQGFQLIKIDLQHVQQQRQQKHIQEECLFTGVRYFKKERHTDSSVGNLFEFVTHTQKNHFSNHFVIM